MSNWAGPSHIIRVREREKGKKTYSRATIESVSEVQRLRARAIDILKNYVT